MIVFGIDCGITGAISAVMDDGSYIDVRDLPIAVNGNTKWIDGQEFLSLLIELRSGWPARAVVERTQAMGDRKSVV